MSTTIYRKVSLEKLRRCLPHRYADQLVATISEPITAVLFSDRVVTGRKAREALEEMGQDFGASVVFAGRSFTLEALEPTKSVGAFMLRTASEAVTWTDRSYQDIKTSIGTHVKRPIR